MDIMILYVTMDVNGVLSPIANNCGGLRCSTVYDLDQPDMQHVIFKSPVCPERGGPVLDCCLYTCRYNVCQRLCGSDCTT